MKVKNKIEFSANQWKVNNGVTYKHDRKWSKKRKGSVGSTTYYEDKSHWA